MVDPWCGATRFFLTGEIMDLRKYSEKVAETLNAVASIRIRKLRLKLHLVDQSLVHIALNIEDTNSPANRLVA